MKIKKGDTVQVIAGKDKGKQGTVTDTLPREDKVVTDGVNVATIHQKNRRTRSQGQIIEKSMPVHVSNVALMDGDKTVRVGYQFEGEGEKRTKVRIARQTGKKI
ncbi:MAG: 50S ribosomal protein L24 [Patescibacteria group bacterium]